VSSGVSSTGSVAGQVTQGTRGACSTNCFRAKIRAQSNIARARFATAAAFSGLASLSWIIEVTSAKSLEPDAERLAVRFRVTNSTDLEDMEPDTALELAEIIDDNIPIHELNRLLQHQTDSQCDIFFTVAWTN
jgi:hypothetical protein